MAELSRTPALPPPEGVLSNFIDPPSRANSYIVVNSIALALMILCVSLRLYAKIWVIHSPGWDDVTCIAATIGQISYTGLIILSTNYGVGKHMWDVSILEIPLMTKYTKIAAEVAEPAIFFTKLTLLLLYFRLFSVKKDMKYCILAGMVVLFVAYTTLLLAYFFLNGLAVNDTVGALNFASDIYIICLPITAVSRLQLPTRKRVGIMLIFLTGPLCATSPTLGPARVLISVISAVIMSLLGLIFRVQFRGTPTSDETWNLISVFIVNSLEVDVGIMCTCMPFFPSLVRKFSVVDKLFSPMKSLRSRFLRLRTTNTTPVSHSTHHQYSKREDYIELGEVQRLTDDGATMAPKTYRMGLEGFSNDDS